MQTAVLFRFHKDDPVSLQNLSIFRHLNPGLPVYGMYGGVEADAQAMRVSSKLDDVWSIPIDDPFYKWKNADACVRWWYRARGHQFRFDHLFLLEWDALFTRPVAQIMPIFEAKRNYGAIVRQDYESAKKDWVWARDYEREIEEFLNYFQQFSPKPLDVQSSRFSIMLGFVFARGFLDKLSENALPTGSNDEFRLGVLSHIWGYHLEDNLIFKNPDNFVRTRGYDQIQVDDLVKIIEKGAVCVHPVRHVLPSEFLKERLGYAC